MTAGLQTREAKAMPAAAPSAPEYFHLPWPIEQKEFLIGGNLISWNGPMETVSSPFCPHPLGSVPRLDRDTAFQALEAAKASWREGTGGWALASVGQRVAALETFWHRLREIQEKLARFILWEIGKSWEDAKSEVKRTLVYLERTIATLKDLDREASRLIVEEGHLGQIRRMPLGIALCMGPYNYPLNETFTTLVPAIAMGNSVIMKPPRLGMLLYSLLLPIFRDCFPPGVVNVVYGDGEEVVSPLLATGDIDALAFIGSSKVADMLKKQHPRPHRLHASLGLEAKNPAIVLPSANLETAVKECLKGALSFNGQRCTAIKMIFVHESLAEAFLSRLAKAVDELHLGMPWEEGVSVTPLPEEKRVAYLEGLMQDALARGAKIANRRAGRQEGTLFAPAVLYPVGDDTRLFHEEQFGPLIPVASFREVGQAIEHVVHSPYGQQASIFGEDPAEVGEVGDWLANQVCRINLNTQCQRSPDHWPFNGRKDSAEGTLSVYDALRVFSIRTIVAANDDPGNKALVSKILQGRASRILSTDFIL